MNHNDLVLLRTLREILEYDDCIVASDCSFTRDKMPLAHRLMIEEHLRRLLGFIL